MESSLCLTWSSESIHAEEAQRVGGDADKAFPGADAHTQPIPTRTFRSLYPLCTSCVYLRVRPQRSYLYISQLDCEVSESFIQQSAEQLICLERNGALNPHPHHV